MNKTATKIRQLRTARSWSQQMLADKAEVSVRTVRRLELGARAPLGAILAVASALDVEAESLLDQTEAKLHGEFEVSADIDSLSDITSMIASVDAAVRLVRILALWQPPHPWATAEERRAEFEQNPLEFEKRRLNRLIQEVNFSPHWDPGPIYAPLFDFDLHPSLDLLRANRILVLEAEISPGTLMHPSEYNHIRDSVEVSVARKNSPILIGIVVYAATLPMLGKVAHAVPALTTALLEHIGQRIQENREYRQGQRKLTLEGRRAAIRRYDVGTEILEKYSKRMDSPEAVQPEVLGPLVNALAASTPPLISHLESLDVEVKGGPLEAKVKKTDQ